MLGTAPVAFPECKHESDWGSDASVSLLILNWNGERFLNDCLRSVMAQACRHVEVVLVDNGSVDGSVQLVKRDFGRARVIVFDDNLGFCVAYNAAAHQVTGRFIVLLNNDTIAEGGWLAALIDELISEPDVAIATSKVLFLGTRVMNSAGGQLKLWQGAWELGFGREESYLDERLRVEPFFASGAALAISRDLFIELGGFDPELGPYGEDLDLSWRARLNGYTIRYVRKSVIQHHYSGTWGIFNPYKHRLATRHYLAAMIKCLSSANLAHAVPAFVIFATMRGAGLAVVERNPAYFVGAIAALIDTAKGWTSLMERRRQVQQRRRASDSSLLESEGFGLFEAPWRLWQLLRQGRQLRALKVRSQDLQPPKGEYP